MKAVRKNTIREILKTKSRFLSILLICTIGVGFFSGVRQTCNDMKISADDYFDRGNLFDVRALSTFGLTDGDYEAIKALDSEYDAFVSKYVDVEASCGDSEYLTRVYSALPENINTIEIYDGRNIENDGECLISKNDFHKGLMPGDRVEIRDLTNADEFPLKRKEYTVVGLYNTPMFISAAQRGSTNVGDGSLDAFMIVPIEEFSQDVYTEIYISSPKLKNMQSYSDEYKDCRAELVKKLEALGEERSVIRYNEVLGDAEKEIEDGERELEKAKADGEKELSDAKKKLDDGKKEIESGEKELSDAKKKLDDGAAQLADGEKALSEAKEKIDDGRAALEAGKAQYNSGLSQYNAAMEEFSANESRLIAAELLLGQAAMAQQRAELEAARALLAENKQKLDDAAAEIAANEALLANGEREYNIGLSEFNEKKAEYEQGLIDYDDGVKKLADAKAEYADGLKKYEDGLSEYNEKIADAEKKLSDAKEKIADAGKARWYVFTRDDNVGYSEYESNADRIDRISMIFPIFFLLVAGLVCLTTMSRMVEEQRTQIGTLKALGYSNGDVMRHYMTYAVSGALIGGTLGAFGGCLLFPTVIMYAYSILYNIKQMHFLFEPLNMILSIGSMVIAIALTVFFSCKKALEETPASLMRPRAPKAGKRVILEKIPFLWNKMSFFAKVSGRNLFRYKKRMFMTIIGIAGCTALSLTGFGLKDSISDIVDLQYMEINKFSGFVAFDDEAKSSDLEKIYAAIEDFKPDTVYSRALIKQYETKRDKNTVQCYVTCIEDSEKFSDFLALRERVSKKELSINDGAIITEKGAKLLGAKEGDEITLVVSEGVEKKVKIAGITEQYISHYIYLTEDMYKDVFGETPKYNIIYFNNGIFEKGDDADAFCEKILSEDKVITVTINASSMEQIHNVLSIMDLVTIVLIVSAGALALVVLYNLSNVNITERIREIATLKVLGFYDIEVSLYVFRESIVLTLLGGLAGLGLGVALCMFVINTAEIDEVMFGRSIHPPSYLWAFLVTTAFSLLVNVIMTRVLRKISMVESLKSIE